MAICKVKDYSSDVRGFTPKGNFDEYVVGMIVVITRDGGVLPVNLATETDPQSPDYPSTLGVVCRVMVKSGIRPKQDNDVYKVMAVPFNESLVGLDLNSFIGWNSVDEIPSRQGLKVDDTLGRFEAIEDGVDNFYDAIVTSVEDGVVWVRLRRERW
jgi:hypothetical protein